jgi:anti-sigma factor RsiW
MFMCPDKELLSAWYDGEVEDPWKREIEAHVGQCGQCRSVIEEFSGIASFLERDRVVLTRFKKKEMYRRVMHQHRRNRIIPIWQKSVPLPVAAAAVLILGVSLIMPAFNGALTVPAPSVALAEEEDLSAIDGLVPIVLPPEQTLAYYGDSQIFKSASYEKESP